MLKLRLGNSILPFTLLNISTSKQVLKSHEKKFLCIIFEVCCKNKMKYLSPKYLIDFVRQNISVDNKYQLYLVTRDM